jgi:protein-tyrosine phosphatase
MPTQPQRQLTWDACYNVRDLGGLPTVDGGETKWRTLVRADILSRLTEQGRAALLDYGIRTVIDLRSPEQVAQEPSAFTAATAAAVGVAYLNLPLEGYDPYISALISRSQTRAEVYCITLDYYPQNIANALRAVATARPGGVVIHCHAGKDRTGIISALLLELAGVPDEHIGADYAASQECLWPLYEKIVVEAGGEDKVDFWWKPTVSPEMIFTVLAHLRATYGSVAGYVRRAGLTPEEVTRLRTRLRR